MSKRYNITFNVYTNVELSADSDEDALEQAKEWFREIYMSTMTFDWDIHVQELPDFD